MTSLNGQLTLFAKDGGSNTIYQPINNKLTIGSDEIADCRLKGVKNVAFVINIDSFGRVFIMSYVKKLKVNGKRMPKKNPRPLMNNSVIEILEYKLCWKYDPKFSKSFSMSPCPKPNQPVNKDILAKRRKTVLCFDSTTVNDQCELQTTLSVADNHDVPGASIKNENDENVPSVATTPKKKPLLTITSPCRSPFKPIVELHETHDQIIDVEASEEYHTLSENISSPEMCDGEKFIESTPSRRRTSLIPVRENRATELRRASIRKSLSKNEQSSSMYFTPKKPTSSSATVKAMNAIIRVGLDDEDTVMNKESSITKRNILDTTNLTKVIDEMNMFNVVTEQMKMVGPSVYVSAKKKVGAMNSPRRTPKKGINTPKRQSLRSELTEMGLFPPVQESSNDDKQQAVAVPANPNLSTEEVDDSDEMECLVISDEEDGQSIKDNEDVEVSDGESNSDTSSESVISVDDESSEDSSAVLTESIVNITSTLSSYSTDSFGTRIQTISDDERKSLLLDAQLTSEETANNDELDDSVFEGNQNASIAAESPTKLNSQQREISRKSVGDLTEGTEIHVHDKQTEQQSEDQQTEICYDESSTNQLAMNESEDVSIPSTGRKSLIRARRNSRLCSLEECCSPTTFGSPRKTKSAMKVPPSPRSILKTSNAPKTPKTPKKNVRILETILHEEEDEDLKITDDNICHTPNVLDHTFEIESESEARNVSLGNVSLPIENNKSLIGQQSEQSSGLTSEITLEEEQLDSGSCENNGEQDEERPKSTESNTEIVQSDVEQLQDNSCVKNQEERPNSPESITKIVPADIKQLQDNSCVNNGPPSKPSKEVIPSVIDKTQLDTNAGVADAYEVDERMDSSELSKKNEKLQECQLNSDSCENDGEEVEELENSSDSNMEIIYSDIKQLKNNSCLKNQEEQRNSPESITEIVPSDIKHLEDNSGVNNVPPSKPSKEVIPSVVDKAQLDTNTGVDDAYEVVERMDSSELSKKNEKLQECQLNSGSCENDGEEVEELPNSSESNMEIIHSDIKQLQNNSYVKNQEERPNSPESITEIIPSDIKQLEDNSGLNNNGRVGERFDLPQPSNEVIPLVVEGAQLDTNNGVDDYVDEVDEQMDSSELSKKNEKLQESQLDSDSCENNKVRPKNNEEQVEVQVEEQVEVQIEEQVEEQVEVQVEEQVDEQPNLPESKSEIIPSDIEELNNERVVERTNSLESNTELILSGINQEPHLDSNSGLNDGEGIEEQINSLETNMEISVPCVKELQETMNEGKEVEGRTNSPDVISSAIQESHLDTYRPENNGEQVEEQHNSPESNSEIIPLDIEELNNESVVERTNPLEPNTELILSGIKQEPELDSNSGRNDVEGIGKQITSSETNMVTNSPDIISSGTEESHLDTYLPKNNGEQVEEQHNSPESNSKIIPSDIEKLNNEQTNSLEPNTEQILSGIKQEPELDSNSGLNDVEGIGEQINSSETNMVISVQCVTELQETLNERGEVEGRTNSPEPCKEVIPSVNEELPEAKLDLNTSVNGTGGVYEQKDSSEPSKTIEKRQDSLLPCDSSTNNEGNVQEPDLNMEMSISCINELQGAQIDSNSGLTDGEDIEEPANSSKTDMEISVQCVKELQKTLNERDEVEGRTNSPEPCKEVIPSANEELSEAKLDLNTSVNGASGVYEQIDSSEPNKKNEELQECLLHYDISTSNDGKVEEPDLNMEISISCINELEEAQLDSNSGLIDGEGIEERTNSSETDVEISVQCVKELEETLNEQDEGRTNSLSERDEGRTNSPEPCKEVIPSVSEELPEAQLELNTCVNGAGGVYERIDSSEPNKTIEKRQECLLTYDSSTNNEEKVQEPSNLPDMEISISHINELQEAQLDSSSGLNDAEGIGEQINSSKTNDDISLSCVKKLQVTLHEQGEEYLNSPDMFNDTIESIKQLQNSSLESNKNDAVQVEECTSKFNNYTNQLVVEDRNDDHGVGELFDSSKLQTETRLVGIEELVQTQSESNSSNEEEEIEKLSNPPEIEKEISRSSVNELQKASMNSNEEKEVKNETSSETKTRKESCKNFSIEVKYKSRETILHTINNALTSIGINPLKWCDSDVEKTDKKIGDVSNDISSQNPNVSTKDTSKDGNADVQSKVDSLCNEIHDDSSLSSLPTESMTDITIHSESAKPQVIDKRNDIESEKITLTDDSEAATSIKIGSQAVRIPSRRGRKTKTTDERVDSQKVSKTRKTKMKPDAVELHVTGDSEETKWESVDSEKVPETPVMSENDMHLPTKRGRKNKTKIADDSETTDTVELQETPAEVPPRRGRKTQLSVTNDSEEMELEKLDSKKVTVTPAASDNDANIRTKKGRKNKTKIPDGSETMDTVEVQKISATPAVQKDDLTSVAPRRGRKIQSTVTNDLEEAELENIDSKKVAETPAASDNDANIPTKRGRANKAKIANSSETTDTVEPQKKSATPAVEKDDFTNLPPRRGRKIQSTVTNDSEEAESEKLDSKKVTETPAVSDNDANIPTKRGRANKAKTADGSETTDTVELQNKSVTTAVEKDDLTNLPPRRGRKIQSTVTNDSEEAESEELDYKKVTDTPAASDNDANIPTKRGRKNKAKIADGSETTDTVELPKKSATPAVEKDDLTNVPLRRGRKIQSTVTNESEETKLEKLDSKKVTEAPAASDDYANIPTKRGRTNKAKIAGGSETTDTVELQKKSVTPAEEKDDSKNVHLRRGRKIKSTVTNETEETELENLDSKKVTETPAASENDANNRTRRGRQTKTNIVDDSKTPKPDTADLQKISATPTVEKDVLSNVPPRRGRKIEATVTNCSEKVTETGEDDPNIPTRKGRTNKTKAAADSKAAKPDTVQLEKISSTPAVDDSDSSNVPVRRGRKAKRAISNISETTESDQVDSEYGTETLVTGDDDLSIPAKRSRKDNKKAVAGSETAKPEAAPTRRGRKVEKIEDSKQSKIKDSQSSAISTQKRRRLSEVELPHSKTDAVEEIEASKVLKRTNRNTATHVSDEPETPSKRRKVDVLKIPITRATRGSRNIEMKDELIQPKQIKHNESQPDPIVHNLRGIRSANVDEATSSTSLGAKSSVKASNRPKRRNK